MAPRARTVVLEKLLPVLPVSTATTSSVVGVIDTEPLTVMPSPRIRMALGDVPMVSVPLVVMRTFWPLSEAVPVKAVYVPRAAMPVRARKLGPRLMVPVAASLVIRAP